MTTSLAPELGNDPSDVLLRRVGGEDGEERAQNSEQRVEDWIASTMADDPPALGSGSDAANDLWADLVGPVAARRSGRSSGRREPLQAISGWARFRLTRRKDVTVVTLTDRSLTRPEHLAELSGDLIALLAAGHRRVVLNFGPVERLTSAVAGLIAEAHRRCASTPGGALKVCGLRHGLAELLTLTGLHLRVSLAPDEASAVEGHWPEGPSLRALPVSVIAALTRAGHDPRPPVALTECDTGHPANDSSPEGASVMKRVRLVVESGRARGRAVRVSGPQFVIGRDASCPLRPGAATVSRFHAAVERGPGGEPLLRDLGSANGTTLNGRMLRGEAAPLCDGDRVGLGPYRFVVEVRDADPECDEVNDLVADWLAGESPADAGASAATADEIPVAAAGPEDDATPDAAVRHEEVEGVLVVTPLVPVLDDGPALAALRNTLLDRFEAGAPRRVVVNLTRVADVTGRAIGVLVAHHLRLDRDSGALRVCEPNPRVAALIDQARLAMLVDVHASLESAVLSSWDCATATA